MIQPVILWTDGLLFFLSVLIVSLVVWGRRQPQVRATWSQVLNKPSGMAGLIVLLAYVLVGLSDSLHFRPIQNGQPVQEVQSLLDVLLSPLSEQTEKTYSAPFANRAFVMETVLTEEGGQIRTFPLLKYGGQHETDHGRHDQYILDIGIRLFLIWAGLALLTLWGMARASGTGVLQILKHSEYRIARTVWITLMGLGAVVILISGYMGEYHILGTDKVGQDVLYQTLKSIRTGLVIGTLTTLIMLPFAISLGLLAGYFRGWVDDVIQYLYTTLSSIPGVLLIAASILVMQAYIAAHPDSFPTLQQRADMRLLFLCLILGITSWTGLCRLLRGEALKLRQVEYVQVAMALGSSRVKILLRHLLPNVLHIVLITIVLDFSGLVLAEAVLSYVGIGVDPTMYSWGNMINAARLELSREPVVWWTLVAAFLFMFFLVLSANLFADAVRDAFDPRSHRHH
ncbi:MAG: ABC transporter permease [Gammaproteobacteria bacterium]|nr:MAG: ABC transporter permease [Gammaproteobacteria bacterium]